MTKRDRWRIEHAIDLCAAQDPDGEEIHSCLALAHEDPDDPLRKRYAKFYGQNGNDYWDFSVDGFRYDTAINWNQWRKYKTTCRVLMLELFRIAEGDVQ